MHVTSIFLLFINNHPKESNCSNLKKIFSHLQIGPCYDREEAALFSPKSEGIFRKGSNTKTGNVHTITHTKKRV